MKKFIKYSFGIMALAGSIILGSCSEFEPEGAPSVPYLAKASDVQASISGRSVTLTWNLPQSSDIEAVRVAVNNGNPTVLPATATSYTLKGQPMEQELYYTVKLQYAGGYVSEGVSTKVVVPHVDAKAAFLLLADNISSLDSDDEQAAANWFVAQPNSELVTVSQLANIDPDVYSVLWIMVDRNGLPLGWENLPSDLVSESTISALKSYSLGGGSLYLSNMATQMTVPLGIVPADMAPTCYGNGDGGEGNDVWTINPHLGWDFQGGSDQGYYDRVSHEVFKGLTMEDPNGYGYDSLPLIGPGQREDHNCLWDCNIYGKGNQPDVIKNFEVTTNSLVLATWGHVRDHCVAGLVEFYSTPEHGRAIANGFAAYEWNQNSGTNIYQKNIEGLTSNIIEYLK